MDAEENQKQVSHFPTAHDLPLMTKFRRRPGGGASLLLQAHCSIRICHGPLSPYCTIATAFEKRPVFSPVGSSRTVFWSPPRNDTVSATTAMVIARLLFEKETLVVGKYRVPVSVM